MSLRNGERRARRLAGVPMLAIAAIVALTGAAKGCEPKAEDAPTMSPRGSGDDDGGVGFECTVDMRSPQVRRSAPNWLMSGASNPVCTEPAHDLSQWLYLEYRSTGTSWVVQEQETDSDIPPAAILISSKSCRVGDWRLRWTASGSGPDGERKRFENSTEETYVSTCP